MILSAPSLTALLLSIGTPIAFAHVSYNGRNFGTLTGSEPATTISNVSVTGAFGWADGTDSDYGDSHRLRAFRFALTYDATVTISVAATSNGGLLLGDLLPGFSLYAGLAHLPPAALDHDGSAVSQEYLGQLGGPAREGCFVALGDWKMGNDDGDLSSFVYKGHAADGSAVNFGPADGIRGDGVADGFVSGTFQLPAGDYSLFVGGALYDSQSSGIAARGMNVSVLAVPEPSTAALALPATVLLIRRRRIL
jgi:hypothetical protein